MIGTTEVRRLSLVLAAVALLGGRAATVAAGDGADDDAPKAAKADIYDPAADADAQIAAAVAKAKRDDSRVLVMFGGNWCGWCHKLHALFRSDQKISHKLMCEYVLVMVDTQAPNAAKWHERALARLDDEERAEAVGVPFLAVIDGDGAIVDAQPTGPLEEGDHHDPAKVLAYLESQEAAPRPPPTCWPRAWRGRGARTSSSSSTSAPPGAAGATASRTSWPGPRSPSCSPLTTSM